MIRVWLVVLLVICTASAALAEPVKKGRVMCEGQDCLWHDVPTGGFLDRAGDFVSDFGDRVKRRIDIAQKEPAPGKLPEKLKEKKSKRASRTSAVKNGIADQMRISQAHPVPSTENTNLPSYYQGIDRSEIEASDKVVFVPKSSDPRMKGLKSGDVVWAVVEQEIVASPSVPTPVRAMAVAGPFKGGLFVGEATLDRELKRILFTFNKLRFKDRDSVYALKAAGLSPRGSIGLEGEYVSQTGKFFIAELAAAGAAGFLDATVNRNQTAFGTYVQEPSLANSGKVAVVTALSKTTDRMAEATRSAPEYTKVPGYQEIQVIIQDDPVETGS